MLKETTVRFRNASGVAYDHNERAEDLVKNEPHIDPNGVHEVWQDGSEMEAYAEVFGPSLNAYNEKQKRKDRKMTLDDYYNSVKSDTRGRQKTKRVDGKKVIDNSVAKGKKTSYEVVFSFGNTQGLLDDNGKVIYDESGKKVKPFAIPDEVNKQACKMYYKEFELRNPNFHVVRCDWHADEFYENGLGNKEYGTPHAHLAYIPVANGYKTGLAEQVSMGKALAQMGYKDGYNNNGKWVCAYEKWESDERLCLSCLVDNVYDDYVKTHPDCIKEYGEHLKIIKPCAGKDTDNLTSAQYRALQDVKEDIANKQAVVDSNVQNINARIDVLNKDFTERELKCKKHETELDKREKALKARESNLDTREGNLLIKEQDFATANATAIKRQQELNAKEKASEARKSYLDAKEHNLSLKEQNIATANAKAFKTQRELIAKADDLHAEEDRLKAIAEDNADLIALGLSARSANRTARANSMVPSNEPQRGYENEY